ncbi:MAG TPA: HisA/HisF family protein [Archaeoglobus profundus]|nr:HisA/HisF family protein [Archaeoglobus profundus]
MRIYFVIDILNGKVVRAFKGLREKYFPIHEFSKVVSSSNVIDVISTIKPRFLYIADLDRIMGRGSNIEIIEKVMAEHVIVDLGFRDKNEINEIQNLKFTPVLGTETFDMTKLEEVEGDIFVSIDLKGDKLLDASKSFKNWLELLEYLNTFDLMGVIILMLDRVGTGTLSINILTKAIELSDNPTFAGGGISSLKDIERLKDLGYEGVLISTAVHLGKIPIDIVQKGVI